ncbi:MAG: AGE family epimerase/isomerase [Pseudomonadota bacterium]
MAVQIHPVILCGGSGTRLWPLSTPARPKQFLSLTSDQCMIEETAARFAHSHLSSIAFSSIKVVGSKQHAKLLDSTLPEASKILEPFGRNSAPAVAAACLSYGTNDLILILPADHDIVDVPAFHQAIEIAADAAKQGAIVTFGIEPTHPATGYGYIKAQTGATEAALPVDAFVEKPDLETAESYLAAGAYYWNAGIFLFKASTMLAALNEFAPDVLAGVKRAMAQSDDQSLVHLDPEAFRATPSISIDYAVMEKAKNVKTVPVSMGWSDVGGYRALHELLTEDAGENYTSGPVVIENSKGLYVRSEGPVISINGVSDLVVVATPNEVMITPMQDDAAVKTLGATVQAERHALGLSPELRDKCKDWLWTAFETWSKVGWDEEAGGFVEQLDMDGTPDLEADRRVRVQARQVFSFAKAIEMGWPETDTAKTIVDRGIAYIDERLRHADGGFIHRIDRRGNALDERRDLYDHAFMILAGAAAYKATNNPTALKIAEDALGYIDAHLKDDVHGGWFESSEGELPRRANPHMHMLEAMLQYHAVTGADIALKHAAEVVRLFETKFFNPATDVMAEFFNADWSLQVPEGEVIWEPGHHYEWATLLYFYDQRTGHDSASWRRRLIRTSDRFGIDPKNGYAKNRVSSNADFQRENSRLWHQTERIRTYLLHSQVASRGQTARIVQNVFQGYLDHGPSGGWNDEVDANACPLSNYVPASMLYHVAACFEKLLD